MNGPLRTAAGLLLAFLVGCSSLAPSPSPGQVKPSASATPSPAPSRATGPPKPSTDPRAVISAFVNDFGRSDTPFHVFSEIRFSGPGEGSATVDMDTSGDDAAGRIHVEIPGQTLDYEVVFAGGSSYVRPAGGDWEVVPGFETTQPINPFGLLDESEIQYLSLTRPLGQGWIYHLRTTEWIGEDPKTQVGGSIKDPAIPVSEFHVYVDEEGIPVNGLLRFLLTGTSDGEPVRLDYIVTYEFSNVGTPVTIEAPDVPE